MGGCATRRPGGPSSYWWTGRPMRTARSTLVTPSTRSSRTSSSSRARSMASIRPTCRAGTATACRSNSRSRRSTGSATQARCRCLPPRLPRSTRQEVAAAERRLPAPRCDRRLEQSLSHDGLDYEAEQLAGAFAGIIRNARWCAASSQCTGALDCRSSLAEAEVQYERAHLAGRGRAFPGGGPARRRDTPLRRTAAAASKVPRSPSGRRRRGRCRRTGASALHIRCWTMCWSSSRWRPGRAPDRSRQGLAESFATRIGATRARAQPSCAAKRSWRAYGSNIRSTARGAGDPRLTMSRSRPAPAPCTTPAHGTEDYGVGRHYGLPGRQPGRTGWPLRRRHAAVRRPERVRRQRQRRRRRCEAGRLLQPRADRHSYPHCWRHKTPVIFRATPQWFLGMERATCPPTNARQDPQGALGAVWGEKRIASMIETRPDWCISRQRAWGVPLALFVHSRPTSRIRKTAGTARGGRGAGRGRRHRGVVRAESRKQAARRRGTDLRSAATSWTCVARFRRRASLPARAAEQTHSTFPADVYLEGSDQHRGWFHSSLLASVAKARASRRTGRSSRTGSPSTIVAARCRSRSATSSRRSRS